MTRSSGPNRQAPQWQQQRPVHQPEASGRTHDAWQELGQGDYVGQQFGAPDNGFGAPGQGYHEQPAQAQPGQFPAQPQFAHNQPTAAPYYNGLEQQQPPLHPQHPGYSDYGQPTAQSAQPLRHAADGRPQPNYSPFDTPVTQPPPQDPQTNYSSLGQPSPQSYDKFRPSSFDHDPNTNWQRPTDEQFANPSDAADSGLYDLGNYMPAGVTQTGRPQFGDPGYVPPQQEWDVNSDLGSQAPGGQFADQRGNGGYDGIPQSLQTGAVTQHADGYADESDEDYDDYYDEEESGTGRKLIIAGALVSAIVVGGGFAYGYNTLFSNQPKQAGTPVVAASTNADKEQPANAGGRSFDNKDSKILGKLGGAASTGQENVGNRVRSVPTLEVGPDGRLVIPEASDNQRSASPTPQVEPAQAAQQESQVASASPVPGMIVSGGVLPPVQPSSTESAKETSAPSTRVPPATQALQPQIQPQQPAQVAITAQTATPTTVRRRNSKFPPLPVRSGITKPQFTTASAVSPAVLTPGIATANVQRVVPNQQQTARQRVQPARAAVSAVSAGSGGNGYVAVLSTKRSRIDALTSFADLQQKYTSILSTKVPDVRRTDLTSRGFGVMYRAVVGPPASKQAAGQLCNRLKSAGYTGCWVAAY